MEHLLKLKSTHFIFKKCPIYTHNGANAKFSTNSHETDYSVGTGGKILVMQLLSSSPVEEVLELAVAEDRRDS
jgi:hypothetical protein